MNQGNFFGLFRKRFHLSNHYLEPQQKARSIVLRNLYLPWMRTSQTSGRSKDLSGIGCDPINNVCSTSVLGIFTSLLVLEAFTQCRPAFFSDFSKTFFEPTTLIGNQLVKNLSPSVVCKSSLPLVFSEYEQNFQTELSSIRPFNLVNPDIM